MSHFRGKDDRPYEGRKQNELGPPSRHSSKHSSNSHPGKKWHSPNVTPSQTPRANANVPQWDHSKFKFELDRAISRENRKKVLSVIADDNFDRFIKDNNKIPRSVLFSFVYEQLNETF